MASILVVCTGNICRSPMAEGFLREALRSRMGEAAPAVSSAGTSGWEGSGAMPEAVEAAEERDTDISGHVARLLLPEHVLEADLVIAMTHEHREAASRSAPDAVARIFTLKELVRLLESLPPVVPEVTPARMAERIGEAGALRASGFEGNPHDEDVADPLGLPIESFRAVAWELDEWCGRLADGLAGRAPVPAPAGGEDE